MIGTTIVPCLPEYLQDIKQLTRPCEVRGFQYSGLTSHRDMHQAHRFYEKHGFTRYATDEASIKYRLWILSEPA